MSVFDARDVTTQQSTAMFDVALREILLLSECTQAGPRIIIGKAPHAMNLNWTSAEGRGTGPPPPGDTHSYQIRGAKATGDWGGEIRGRKPCVFPC